jgi:hypothetical protein
VNSIIASIAKEISFHFTPLNSAYIHFRERESRGQTKDGRYLDEIEIAAVVQAHLQNLNPEVSKAPTFPEEFKSLENHWSEIVAQSTVRVLKAIFEETERESYNLGPERAALLAYALKTFVISTSIRESADRSTPNPLE